LELLHKSTDKSHPRYIVPIVNLSSTELTRTKRIQLREEELWRYLKKNIKIDKFYKQTDGCTMRGSL